MYFLLFYLNTLKTGHLWKVLFLKCFKTDQPRKLMSPKVFNHFFLIWRSLERINFQSKKIISNSNLKKQFSTQRQKFYTKPKHLAH